MKKPINAMLLAAAALVMLSAERCGREHVPRVADLRGGAVDLDSAVGDSPLLVVCYSRYNCHDCFLSLGKAIERVRRTDTSLRVVVVARGGVSALARRSLNKEARGLLPEIADVYFDCIGVPGEDPWPPLDVEGGVFGTFSIGRTPALLYRGSNGAVKVALNDALTMPEMEDGGRKDSAEIEFLQRRIEGMIDR